MESVRRKHIYNHATMFDVVVYFAFCCFFLADYVIRLDFSMNVIVQFTFLLIGGIAFAMFVTDKRYLTIDKVLCIFLFLFMYYVPYHQFFTKTSYWGMMSFADSDYLYANFLILGFEILYFASKRILFKRVGKKRTQNKRKSKNIFYHKLVISDLALGILTVFTLLSVIYLYSTHNLISLGSPTSSGDSTTLSSFILKIIRFFPAATLMLSIFSIKQKAFNTKSALNIFCVFINAVVFIIIFFPLNGKINRYFMFGTYIMIIACLFDDIKHNSIVMIVAFLGFGFVFTAFNFFKTNSLSDLKSISQLFANFDYTSPDYDAYYMLMCGMKYVNLNGTWHFKNILTMILCFVPRSIWPGKLNHSGQIVGEFFNANFTNISMPIMAEFYLAGGVLAVIVLTVITAWLTKVLEIKSDGWNLIWKGLYIIIMGLATILFRGAVLPIATYVLALFVSYLICFFIVRLCRGRIVRKDLIQCYAI